jgi:hypothetical protein
VRKPLTLAALCLSVTPACTDSPVAKHATAASARPQSDAPAPTHAEGQSDAPVTPPADDEHDGDAGGELPPALAHRIDELNHCQSRLQDTHATYPVQEIQGEEGPTFLYAFYNLDETGLDNIFTRNIPGKNEQCELPANEAIGTVRAVLEAKPGAVVDPNDPRSLIDIFTDVCGLIVINNESGWYEGWIMHDVRVPEIGKPDEKGHAPFGLITEGDAKILKGLGTGQDVPGHLLTVDGNPPDPFGDHAVKTQGANLVTVPVSLGAWNALQGEDAHAYWELNEYTNFTFPLYEVPTTGGFDETYARGWQYGPLGGIGPDGDSRIPGSGPSGVIHFETIASKVKWGDDPSLPRDADRTPETCGEDESTEEETRLRYIPSGLAREILLDVYARPASFEPAVLDPVQRYFDAYAYEVARIDENGDGVLQFDEVDIEDESDGLPNLRLYLPPNQFDRMAVTREINDGLLAPRYATQQQRAFVLTGVVSLVPID